MPRTRLFPALLLLAACGSENPPAIPPATATAGGHGGSGGAVQETPGSAGTTAAGGTTSAATAGAGGGNSGGQSGLSGQVEAGAGGAEAVDPGGAGGAPTSEPCAESWPAPTTTTALDEPLAIDGHFDGALQRYTGPEGSGGQDEDQDPLFVLEDGAVLENVVIGAPAGDGIHCEGSCTLRNVWWEDVGEDAATFRGEDPQQTMLVECGGAKLAEDKVFQHNGAGTLTIRQFEADDFGKLYRSCGNCSTMYERHVELDHVVAQDGDALVGINENYGDTARFSDVVVLGSPDDTDACQRYEGNDQGDEPVLLGTGPDPEHCLYEEGDVTFSE